MGTFVISTKENGEFKFTYNNRRGKTVLTSPGFKTKEDCYASIENLKTNFLLTSHPKFKSVSEKPTSVFSSISSRLAPSFDTNMEHDAKGKIGADGAAIQSSSSAFCTSI